MWGLPRHILTMADFLEYLRKRRGELRKELAALDTAERIYRQSQRRETAQEPLMASDEGSYYLPRTIKQMVARALEETQAGGLTSSQILENIQQRWMPSLKRSSLAPQLTRLRRDGLIFNDKRIWKLVEDIVIPDGTSQNSDASPSEPDEASSSGGVPEQV